MYWLHVVVDADVMEPGHDLLEGDTEFILWPGWSGSIGVSYTVGADQSCHSRSVNPFSSVYNTAIRPSRTSATS